MKTSDVRKLSAQLIKLVGLPLDDFIHQAAEIHPVIAQRVGGIYCGTAGTAYCENEENDELGNKHCVVFGWYNSRVEYAYIS